MREPLQMGEQLALQIVDESMTGKTRPVVAVVAGRGLRREGEREGELADAHQGGTHNQLRVRLQIGQEPEQRMLRSLVKSAVHIRKTPFVCWESGPPNSQPVNCNRRAP